MEKFKQGTSWDQAYEPAEFAARYGMTLGQAIAVIKTNGPSRAKCDIAAPIFLKAAMNFGKGRRRTGDSTSA